MHVVSAVPGTRTRLVRRPSRTGSNVDIRAFMLQRTFLFIFSHLKIPCFRYLLHFNFVLFLRCSEIILQSMFFNIVLFKWDHTCFNCWKTVQLWQSLLKKVVKDKYPIICKRKRWILGTYYSNMFTLNQSHFRQSFDSECCSHTRAVGRYYGKRCKYG